MKTYQYWAVLDELPDGWVIDRTCGSPLAGHVFATNGKSPLTGQRRVLVPVRPKGDAQAAVGRRPELVVPVPSAPKSGAGDSVFDAGSAKAFNDLARARFKRRLLSDILVDLQVCDIEGWSKREYIEQLQQLIGGISLAAPDDGARKESGRG
ncbi:hypothetical protein [Xenophilus sp. Marseille-Q4582]|uniref:hypothetical protein n=1 Tax=Xenophilus sp. Marseille-Q4582 TaxID=2866600 RepID=UPI001CE3C8F0|nr:hypothetical protein [Xenophilus sp. Marseille-Q4582]